MCIFFQAASLLTKQRFRVGIGSSCKMKPIMRDEALNAFKTHYVVLLNLSVFVVLNNLCVSQVAKIICPTLNCLDKIIIYHFEFQCINIIV